MCRAPVPAMRWFGRHTAEQGLAVGMSPFVDRVSVYPDVSVHPYCRIGDNSRLETRQESRGTILPPFEPLNLPLQQSLENLATSTGSLLFSENNEEKKITSIQNPISNTKTCQLHAARDDLIKQRLAGDTACTKHHECVEKIPQNYCKERHDDTGQKSEKSRQR